MQRAARKLTYGLVLAIGVTLATSPPPALAACVFSDDFAHPDGFLAGQGSWEGTSTPGIVVESERVKLSFEDTGTAGTVSTTAPTVSDVVTFTIDVMSGSSISRPDHNAWWLLRLYDDTGNSPGMWGGVDDGGETYDGVPTSGSGVHFDLSGLGTWDELKAIIDFHGQNMDFYFNDEYLNSVTFATGGSSLEEIEFQTKSFAMDPGQSIYFDNLCVTPEPATLSLLVIGGWTALRQKRL